MAPVGTARAAFAAALTDALPERSEAVRQAFARVPRESHLGPPPWSLRSPGHAFPVFSSEPAALYWDALIDIDPKRQINNGLPSLWAGVYAALRVSPGERVLHIGCGTGYYTAVLAELVGVSGHVLGVELEADLAERARKALTPYPQVEVMHADGSQPPVAPVDVIVVNAGATRIVAPWLDRLSVGGRVYVPLTVNLEDPLRGIGVGIAVIATRRDEGAFDARFAGTVGIYPCVGARSAEENTRLHAAIARGLDAASEIASVRRDDHRPDASCWFHVDGACVSTRQNPDARS